MINALHLFFKNRLNQELPLLLAFSGGPDSLALLHLFLEYQKTHPVRLALAHIDHGWRAESASEAVQIASMAKQLGLVLHQKTLDPETIQGNLEAACREARLKYFVSLCQEYNYQAVLLAHHADDVAETVLKRALEGVTLPYLAAIRSEMIMEGVKVWRPLVTCSKKDLQNWLNQKGLKGFDDATNRDPKYMRARFRVQIIPYLSEVFGKKVDSGLCQISQEASELREYLDERIQPYLNRMIHSPEEYRLDLAGECPQSLFELKYLIRQFCKKSSFALSRQSVQKAAEFLQQKVPKKCFVMGRGEFKRFLWVDRGCLSCRP
jgi:tRNA(Ile)-lysidine synthase